MTSMHTSLTTPEEIRHWFKAYGLPYDVSEAIRIVPGKGYIFDRLYGVNAANGHWNFIYTSPNGKEVLVYDPFGIPFFVPEFKDKKVIYSISLDQKLNEKSCGLYCFLFAFKLFNGILHLTDYLYVDYPTKSYYESLSKMSKQEFMNQAHNRNKYTDIYEELHNERAQRPS